MEPNDAQLVERAQDGDHKAFEMLVERHENKVYGLAYRLMGNAADAEDVLQDAFLSAYRGLKKFQGKSSFSTWLYRLATNAALIKLRKGKRQQSVSLDEPIATDQDGIQREVVDWSTSPEILLEGKEK